MMLSLLNCCVRSTDCFGVVGDVVVLVDGLVNVNSVVLHWSFYWWFVQVLSVPLLGIVYFLPHPCQTTGAGRPYNIQQ